MLQRLKRRLFRSEALTEGHVRLVECVIFAPVKVGYRSYANPGTYIRNAEIGRFCSIGRRVSIGAARHRIEALSTHPSVAEPEAPKTTIGNDVWIGDNAVILAGLWIGDGSVIGAGAIVTKDVEPYTIVGGVPARVIGRRGPPELSEWWKFGDPPSSDTLPPHFKRRRF